FPPITFLGLALSRSFSWWRKKTANPAATAMTTAMTAATGHPPRSDAPPTGFFSFPDISAPPAMDTVTVERLFSVLQFADPNFPEFEDAPFPLRADVAGLVG